MSHHTNNNSVTGFYYTLFPNSPPLSGMDSKNLTDKEKIEFLKQNLSDEAKAAMDELLAQGYTMEEVIELFKKHGNNLNAIDSELSSPSVTFDEEPPDAHLYANRDVFSVIDRDIVKSEIPYLSPSIKNLTFKQFLDKVQKLVKGRGLTHRYVKCQCKLKDDFCFFL